MDFTDSKIEVIRFGVKFDYYRSSDFVDDDYRSTGNFDYLLDEMSNNIIECPCLANDECEVIFFILWRSKKDESLLV